MSITAENNNNESKVESLKVEEDNNNNSTINITSHTNSKISLCQRLKWELCHTSYKNRFDLKEEEASAAGSGGYINVELSFGAKRSYNGTILMKTFLLFWSLQVLCTDVIHYPPHNLYIYMGYLTHWGHVMSILYFISSLYCNIKRSVLIQPCKGSAPSFPIRLTWVLYSIVAPMEICITLLYWSADYSGGDSINYITVMEHGIICLFVLIDGLIISIIPMRIKLYPYFISICLCYLLWSIIDAVFNIGNGEWGPEYEDDALYEVLNWNNNSKKASIISSIVICIIAPLVYLFCWILSLWDGGFWSCNLNFDGSRRKFYYYDARDIVDNNDHEKDFDYKAIEVT